MRKLSETNHSPIIFFDDVNFGDYLWQAGLTKEQVGNDQTICKAWGDPEFANAIVVTPKGLVETDFMTGYLH